MLCSHLNNYKYHSANSNPADVIISIASCVTKEEDEVVNLIDVDAEQGTLPTGTIKRAEEMKKDCEEMMLRLSSSWPKHFYANTGQAIEMHGLGSSGSDHFKLYSLWVLLKRTCVTSLFRQKRLIFIRLALHVVVAAVLTLLYDRNIGKASDCYINTLKNCSDVEDELRKESVPDQNIRFQFFSLLFLMFAALMPTVLTFPTDIMVRDR